MKNYKRLAVAFTGKSNSGKTTLLVKVSQKLQEDGYKVAMVKHDPHDKAIFDKEGKDSHKFSSTGADVVVISPTRTTMFKKEKQSINQIIELFGDFDYLLVEGLKSIPLPRICVARDTLHTEYFDVTDTLATDDSINKSDIPSNMECLNLNNPDDIISWINNNAKQV
jgi:molybdopterin-guanine dinucleotide biosynthesis adapter protein